MIIHSFLMNYNGEKLLPFVLKHYGAFCDQITIFDNHSTDRSKEIISSFPNTKIIGYDPDGEGHERNFGQLNDVRIRDIKNECWKASAGRCDWVVVADLDELLYAPDLKGRLAQLEAEGKTIIKPVGYNMISETFPRPGNITDQVKCGVRCEAYSKQIIFDPTAIEEINYAVGAHTCEPQGLVRIYKSDGDIKVLHYKFLSMNYYLEKCEEMAKNMNAENLAKGWGVQAKYTTEQNVAVFNNILAEAKEVI